MNTLHEGVQLSHIYFVAQEETCFVVGEPSELTVKSITVEMQNGQMAEVPWARVIHHTGKITLVNLATTESVVLLNGDL